MVHHHNHNHLTPPAWLQGCGVRYCWAGTADGEKIVLNPSLPFQSVCMFLFIMLQFLSTYAIIKFPDPCLTALTRHWEIYSHCRSLSLMCPLPPTPPSLPSPSLRNSPSPPLSLLLLLHHLLLYFFSPFLSESPWHCSGIRIINRVIVWNTLVCIEFLSLIFNAWLPGCWLDSAPHSSTSLRNRIHTHLSTTTRSRLSNSTSESMSLFILYVFFSNARSERHV